MKRYCHWIRPTRGGKQPPSIIAVALGCSTLAGKGQCAADRVERWAIVHDDSRSSRGRKVRYQSGRTPTEFWDAIGRIAHSGGQHWIIGVEMLRALTLLRFWESIEEGGISLCGEDWRSDADTEGGGIGAGYCVTEDPPTSIFAKVGKEPGRLILLDWRNWGAGSFPELGIPGTTLPAREEAWNDTVEFSAFRLMEAVNSLKTELVERGLGRLQFTAGSQALYSWKHKHLTHKPICHVNYPCLEMERSAYFSGRNECFRLGPIAGPVYELDFRSFYVEICFSTHLPGLLEEYNGKIDDWSTHAAETAIQEIAEVVVETRRAVYPYRPDPAQPETLYPVGRFPTCLCGPELAAAVKRGDVKKILRRARYVLAPVLRSFANEMLELRYSAREEGDRVKECWAKSIGVCLPGKLGQKWKRWVDSPDAVPWAPFLSWFHADGRTRLRALAWRTQKEETLAEHPESVPAIAAWVTSEGRRRLQACIEIAGEGEVHYVDTDSLFCTSVGYSRLLESGKVGNGQPGLLRLVHQHEWMTINGLKWYATPQKEVCAGMPKGSVLATGSDHEYWWTGGLNVRCDGKGRPSPEKILKAYKRHGGYPYGTVDRHGVVSPLEVHVRC